MNDETRQLLIKAADWHDAHREEQGHDWSSCWCCCITCEHVNPFFDDAQAAMQGDAPGRG